MIDNMIGNTVVTPEVFIVNLNAGLDQLFTDPLTPSVLTNLITSMNRNSIAGTFRETSQVRTTTLAPTDIPLVMSGTPEVTITAGNNVTLHCNATGFPLVTSVYWNRQVSGGTAQTVVVDSVHYAGVTLDDPSLTIINVMTNDSGMYICKANNSVGTGNTSYVTLDVQDVPVVMVDPQDVIVVAGDNVTLFCNATGNPVLTAVYWQVKVSGGQDKLIVVDGTNYSGGTIVDPSLTIINVTTDDSAMYICTANNSIGTGSSEYVTLVVQDIPVVTVDSTDVTVTADDDVTLTCTATGNPAPTAVYWQVKVSGGQDKLIVVDGTNYSGVTIDNPSLTIINVTTDNSAMYICRANNSIGTGSSEYVTLDVQYVPVMMVDPQDVIVVAGDNVTLFCNATGNPAPTAVYWQVKVSGGQDKLIVVDGTNYSGGTIVDPSLTIINVTTDDSAMYICTANNSIGTGSSEYVTLVVQDIPVVTVDSTDVTVTADDDVTLTCTATGNPAPTAVYWQVKVSGEQDKLIVVDGTNYSGVTIDNPSLTIINVTTDNSAMYICRANNSIGTGSSEYVTLDVQYVPVMMVDPQDVIVVAGDNVTLFCNATGNPAPTAVYWQVKVSGGQDKLIVVDGTNYSGGTIVDPSLTIINVTTDDSAMYICGANNSIGTGSSEYVTLVVQDIPVVMVDSTDVTVTADDDVTLTCTATGNPAPTAVYWQVKVSGGQDKLIVVDGTNYSGVTIDNPSLTIINVTTDNSAMYICRANNSIGTGSSEYVTLDVQYVPVVMVDLQDVIVVAGDNVTLFCNATGNPAPTAVYWQVKVSGGQDKLIVVDGTNYSGGTIIDPSLTIINVTTDDSAMYICRANNSIGTGNSDYVTVVVQDVPTVTVSDGGQAVGVPVGQNVTLTCTATGNPAPTAVYWQVKVSGGQDKLIVVDGTNFSGGTIVDPSLTIINVTTDNNGMYICRANNSIGTGSSDYVTIDVTDIPVVTVTDQNVPVTVGDNVTLTCAASANPSVTEVYWEVTFGGGEAMMVEVDSINYSGVTINDPSLTIIDVKTAHSGMYICKANNSIGTGSSDYVTLDVQYIPMVMVTDQNVTVTTGDNVTLFCNATGNPRVTAVYWEVTFGGGEAMMVEVNGTYYSGVTINDPSLTIIDVKTAHSGMYICKANNSIGTGSSDYVMLDVQDVSMVMVYLTNVTAVAGDNVTLTCNVTGNPEATVVYWDVMVDGGQTEVLKIDGTNTVGGTLNDPSVTLISVMTNDSSIYICKANNSIGTGSSEYIILDVQDIPVVTVTDQNVTVTAGENVTLFCNATGNPSVTAVYWEVTFGGGEAMMVEVNGTNYSGVSIDDPSLTIIDVMSADSGMYICKANNSIGTGSSDYVILDVQDIPMVTVTDQNVTVTAGDNVTLFCNATGNPRVTAVYWEVTFGGAEAMMVEVNGTNYSGVTIDDPSLTISDVKTAHSGMYICKANNSIGTGSSDYVTLDVQDIPMVTVTDQNVTVTAGDNVTLFCNATGNPRVTAVYWEVTFGGGEAMMVEIYGTNYSGVTIDDPSLTIIDVMSADSGIYICKANNSIGTGSSDFVILNVQDIPMVMVYPTNVTAVAGDNVTLTCNVTGNPEATVVYWDVMVDGGQTEVLEIDGTNTAGGTLNVPSVTLISVMTNDSGIYICKANNSIGTGSSEYAILDVQDIPMVMVTDQNVTVTAGDNITLFCNATGNPSVTAVYWEVTFGGGEAMMVEVNGTNYSGVSIDDPSLTIIDVMSADSGIYICKANNSIGTGSSDYVMLDVQDIPMVTVTDQNVTVTAGDNVTLFCNATGNPSVTAVYWEVMFGGGEARMVEVNGTNYSGVTIDDPSLTIIDVMSANSGMYICKANNSIGTGRSDYVMLDVQGVPEVVVSNTSVIGDAGFNVTLDCVVTANPPADSVFWYKIVNGTDYQDVITDNVKYTGSTPQAAALTIIGAGLEDAGVYQCNANNSIGTGSGLSITLAMAPISVEYNGTLALNETFDIQLLNKSSQEFLDKAEQFQNMMDNTLLDRLNGTRTEVTSFSDGSTVVNFITVIVQNIIQINNAMVVLDADVIMTLITDTIISLTNHTSNVTSSLDLIVMESVSGVIIKQDDCASTPCLNGGNCTDLLGDFLCDCVPGFDGKDCSQDLDVCTSGLCYNGGTCVEGVGDLYTCDCRRENTGSFCESPFCPDDWCYNGGSCMEGNTTVYCVCTSNFTGSMCETDICGAAFCENGGICNTVDCDCSGTYYTGPHCTLDKIEYLDGPNGTFSSPNFPGMYPILVEKTWIITMDPGQFVLLSFLNFSTESNYDDVTVYDGEDSYSSELNSISGSYQTFSPGPYKSSGRYMAVHFSSDRATVDTGFLATYTSDYVMKLYGPTGFFMSPNFPDNYNNYADLTWLITVAPGQAVLLSFVEFDTEGYYDFVYVYDGPDTTATKIAEMDGTTIPYPFRSSDRFMTIHFSSDSSYTQSGFYANYSAVEAGEYKGPQGTIFSPNFPQNYFNNANITWLIEVDKKDFIIITFEWFDIETGWDNLYIYDGNDTSAPMLAKLTGTFSPESISSTGSSMLLHFRSDNSITTSGFHINYHTKQIPCGFGQITCLNAECLDISQACDRTINCPSGSDEWPCVKDDLDQIGIMWLDGDIETTDEDFTLEYEDASSTLQGILSESWPFPIIGEFNFLIAQSANKGRRRRETTNTTTVSYRIGVKLSSNTSVSPIVTLVVAALTPGTPLPIVGRNHTFVVTLATYEIVTAEEMYPDQPSLTGSDVRLVGGPSCFQGRVEVRNKGVWGSVCASMDWSPKEATVVCDMLGLSSGNAAPGVDMMMEGNTQVWLAGVTCDGDETSLSDCRHHGWGITPDCNPDSELTRVATVICDGRSDPVLKCTYEMGDQCPMTVTGSDHWYPVSATDHTDVNTGPHFAIGGNRYMLYNSDRNLYNQPAVLQTPVITGGSAVCLSFYYYMYGGDVGKFLVFDSFGRDILTLTGDQGPTWHFRQVTLNHTSNFQVYFEVMNPRPYIVNGDVALDEVYIVDGACSSEESTCSLLPVDPPTWPPDTLAPCRFGDGTSNDMCGYTSQVSSGTLDWLHSQALGSVRPDVQLPSNEYGSYMVYYDVSGSDAAAGHSATLMSPAFVTGSTSRLEFLVHTAGDSVLSVMTNGSQSQHIVTSLENRWLHKCMDLPADVTATVVLTATQGSDTNSHIAVKNVGVQPGSCPVAGSCTFNEPGDCHYLSVYDHQMPSMAWGKVDLSRETSFPLDHTTMSPTGGVYRSQQFDKTGNDYDGHAAWLLTSPIDTSFVSSVEFRLIKGGHSRLIVGFKPWGIMAENQTMMDDLMMYNMDPTNSSVVPLLVLEGSDETSTWRGYCVDLTDVHGQNGSVVFMHVGVDNDQDMDAYVYLDDVYMAAESCQKSLDTCDWEKPYTCGIQYLDSDVCPLQTDYRWQFVGFSDDELILFADATNGWPEDNATVYLTSNSSGQSLQFMYRFRSDDPAWISVSFGSHEDNIRNIFHVDNWQFYCADIASDNQTLRRLELQTQKGHNPSADVGIKGISWSESQCPEVSANCTFDDGSTCGFSKDSGWELKKYSRQPGYYIAIHTGYSEYQYRSLLSPPVVTGSPACVEFMYRMKISVMGNTSYIVINIFNLMYDEPMSMMVKNITYHSDSWVKDQFQVNFPNFRFQIQVVSDTIMEYSFDDFIVTDGSCDPIDCGDSLFSCLRDNMCIDMDHVCDDVEHCPSGEDEADCNSPPPERFDCSFEDRDICQYMTYNSEIFRTSECDHTFRDGTGHGLQMSYLDYRGFSLQYMESHEVMITQPSCLTFYVQGYENADIPLSVSLKYADGHTNRIGDCGYPETSSEWNRVSLDIPAGNYSLVFEAGNYFYPSYFRMCFDDINVIDGKSCEQVGCAIDEFSCPNTLLCIPADHVCDITQHCPGGEDELNCRQDVTCDFDEDDVCKWRLGNDWGYTWQRNSTLSYWGINLDSEPASGSFLYMGCPHSYLYSVPLMSPQHTLWEGDNYCLEFAVAWFHPYFFSYSKLELKLYSESTDVDFDWERIEIGNMDVNWSHYQVDLGYKSSRFGVIFSGSTYQSFIALDNVTLTAGMCIGEKSTTEMPTTTANPATNGTSNDTTPPELCMRVNQPICNTYGYNNTSLPNVLCHDMILEAERSMFAASEVWVSSVPIPDACQAALMEGLCAIHFPMCSDGNVTQLCKGQCEKFFTILDFCMPEFDDPSYYRNICHLLPDIDCKVIDRIENFNFTVPATNDTTPPTNDTSPPSNTTPSPPANVTWPKSIADNVSLTVNQDGLATAMFDGTNYPVCHVPSREARLMCEKAGFSAGHSEMQGLHSEMAIGVACMDNSTSLSDCYLNVTSCYLGTLYCGDATAGCEFTPPVPMCGYQHSDNWYWSRETRSISIPSWKTSEGQVDYVTLPGVTNSSLHFSYRLSSSTVGLLALTLDGEVKFQSDYTLTDSNVQACVNLPANQVVANLTYTRGSSNETQDYLNVVEINNIRVDNSPCPDFVTDRLCDFDSADLCGFTFLSTCDPRDGYYLAGPRPYQWTARPQAESTGFFLMADASYGMSGSVTTLTSPSVPVSSTDSVRFSYFSSSHSNITSNIQAYLSDDLMFARDSLTNGRWEEVCFDLKSVITSDKNATLKISSTRGIHSSMDIGFDNISITSNRCPHVASCDFERYLSICDYQVRGEAGFKFIKTDYCEGPDHTTGNGSMMCATQCGNAEYSNGTTGNTTLETPEFLLDSTEPQSVSFFFRMDGDSVGALDVSLELPSQDPQQLFYSSGNNGNRWYKVCKDIPMPTTNTTGTMTATAIHGDGCFGDYAMDDILFLYRPCPEILVEIPCHFAEPYICDYQVSSTNASRYGWEIRQGINRTNMGPYSDAGGQTFGNFLLAQGLNAQHDDNTFVCFPPRTIDQMSAPTLRFMYHMAGAAGNLSVVVNGTVMWSRSGNQDGNWLSACQPITAGTNVEICFEASPNGDIGDIALDDVSIKDEVCAAPVVSCDFDTSGDSCGYISVAGQQPSTVWHQRPWDENDESKGFMMISGSSENDSNESRLLSPPVPAVGMHCLAFDYRVTAGISDSNILSLYATHKNGSVDQLLALHGKHDGLVNTAQVPINVVDGDVVRAMFVRHHSVAVIDQVMLTQGPCPPVECEAYQFNCSEYCIPQQWQCDWDLDCAAEEDEALCGRAIECDFNDPYVCGYVANNGTIGLERKRTMWTGYISLFGSDRQANREISQDYFLGRAGDTLPSVMSMRSPVIPVSGPSCLHFFYVGNMASFKVEDNNGGWFEDNTFASPYDWRQGQFSVMAADDFEATFTVQPRPDSDYHFFGLDSIQLTSGYCPDVIDCVDGGFYCNVSGICIPKSAHCDGVVDCEDGSDEMCDTSISCDFEHPFICGYTVSDASRVIRKQGHALHLPDQDHTFYGNETHKNFSGHYMYFESPYSRTRHRLESPVESISGDGCLSLYYNMEEGIAAELHVSLHVNDTEWPLIIDNGKQIMRDQWVFAQIPLDLSVWNLTGETNVSVLFDFYGSNIKFVPGSLAIDDVNLTSPGTCEKKVRCLENSFLCASGDFCIPSNMERDGVRDCPDGSDDMFTIVRDDIPTEYRTFECMFEKEKDEACWLMQSDEDDWNWTRYNKSTPSTGTGPIIAAEGIWFMYYETSYDVSEFDRAILHTGNVTIDNSSCLHFYYHMYGGLMGSLTIYSDMNGERTELWRKEGNRGSKWTYDHVDIPAGNQDILIVGEDGGGFTSDMSIDSVVLVAMECPQEPNITREESVSHELRIVGGDTESYGRIEIASNNASFQAVCETDWIDANSEVFCRQIGFGPHGIKTRTYREGEYASIRSLYDEIVFGGFSCNGTEKTLLECNATEADCTSGYQIAVACSNNACFAGERACISPMMTNIPDDAYCIWEEKWCDGVIDCPNVSDENYCANCSIDQYECDHHMCIPLSQRCDGVNDCGDWSDEHFCIRLNDDYTVEAHHQGEWMSVCSPGQDEVLAGYLCALATSGSFLSFPTSTMSSDRAVTVSYDRDSQGIIRSHTIQKTPSVCTEWKLECQPQECGRSVLALDRVISGYDVPNGWFPAMMALMRNSSGTHMCGASLISPTTALTAAHCVDDWTRDSAILHVGEVDYEKFGQFGRHVPIAEVILHEDHNEYDFAILKFAQPIQQTDTIGPVCLPPPWRDMFSYHQCFVLGWGTTEYGRVSTKLRALEVVLLGEEDKERCEDRARIKYGIYGNHTICVDNREKHSPICFGDSGGPLICKNPHGRFELLGVTSYGDEVCLNSEFTDVYENVMHYTRFVLENTDLLPPYGTTP
ncbi:uncharacterized protein [Argopecten irradians]|uniref:uncharacterized protein isoform X2 n=1 Tax=Argopecten irradians TaxID=31199 RepID=UPI003714D66B